MRRRARVLLRFVGVLALAAGAGSALRSADGQELVTRDGKIHRGHAFPGAQEYRLNPYGSSAPEMTRGIRTFRARDVQEVRDDPTAAGFRRQLEALSPRDIDGRVKLLRWAQTRRLRPQIAHAAAEVLRLQPTHAEALDAIKGAKRWEKLRRGHPVLDAELVAGLRRLIRLEAGEAREAAAKRLAVATGADLPAHLVERMARSLTADRGLRSQIPLTLDAEEHGTSAKYDLFVPEDYDPLEPRPLLLALHGGGILQSEGEKVLGTGRDATALYLEGCRRNGWILVAPNAIEAPWAAPANAAYLEAVLAEVTALWNVDLDRVHVAGTGGGGNGAWAYAAKHADELASVGIASAGEPKGHAGIVAKTALWLYHGDEDEILPVDPVRKVADRLARSKGDFVYCELPGEKHGFPPPAERDYFSFAAPRRRRKARTTWPRASFAVPPTSAEIKAFGHPAGGWGETLDADLGPNGLVDVLARGHPDAEPAARKLVALGSEAAVVRPAVRAIVKDRKRPNRARAWAAWVLGTWRDADALNVLGDVLRGSKDAVLLRRAADAVGRLANPDSQEDVRFALSDLTARYKALKGKTVPYVEYERACRLGAALARAMGRVGKAAEVQADLEESLVIGILRDRRRVTHRPANGEDPMARKAELAEALGRAYRAMKAERTLAQMLLAVLRKSPRAQQAAAKGLREGLPPLR